MLDIIVPVYNEDQGIIKLFNEILEEIQTPKRVLVVYDFEEDTTVPVVKKREVNIPLRLFSLEMPSEKARLTP